MCGLARLISTLKVGTVNGTFESPTCDVEQNLSIYLRKNYAWQKLDEMPLQRPIGVCGSKPIPDRVIHFFYRSWKKALLFIANCYLWRGGNTANN